MTPFTQYGLPVDKQGPGDRPVDFTVFTTMSLDPDQFAKLTFYWPANKPIDIKKTVTTSVKKC